MFGGDQCREQNELVNERADRVVLAQCVDVRAPG